ncbi:MAG: TonB-dependent receptor, partial [Xanthomonadales bacterium]|nr:TonB-dependent receptor [Xanthomonadales bacterium]
MTGTKRIIKPPCGDGRDIVTRRRKLVAAVCAALASSSESAMAQDTGERGKDNRLLEEVLVTATKRQANLMELPESIQALAESQLELAGVYAMDDYVRYIPSLSYVSLAPGEAKITFRGVAANVFTLISEPTAALYLNDQSLTMNALPNVRIVDVERIEALSGPQGTLYGASAQSGVLRIVTNKPDHEGFDASFDVMYRTGAESAASYDLHGMINVPLSDDFAVRIVGFSAEEDGYIDNVFGVTPRFGLFDNAGAEENNYNKNEYRGGRMAASWLINDRWSMDASIIHQDTRAEGYSVQDPTLDQPFAVVRFLPNREFDDSKWTQYAVTFEGDLGFADFVSATSYFTRDWTYSEDTSTGYVAYFGTFCYSSYYYDWSQYSRYCFQPADLGNYYNDPIGYRQQVQKDTKFSQEFRLVSQGPVFDWLAGLFYETHDEHWDFDTLVQGYDESKSVANYFAGNMIARGNPVPSRLPDDVWWFSTQSTDRSQFAAFGEITWHLTDSWDVTLG